MANINFDDFKKIELKTAKVLKAERIEGSEKLIRLEVYYSSASSEQVSLASSEQIKNEAGLPAQAGEFLPRQIIAGIGLKYQPEDLIGKTVIIVANLEPRKLMGLESQGMLLAASNQEQGPILLTTMEDINPGSEIR